MIVQFLLHILFSMDVESEDENYRVWWPRDTNPTSWPRMNEQLRVDGRQVTMDSKKRLKSLHIPFQVVYHGAATLAASYPRKHTDRCGEPNLA